MRPDPVLPIIMQRWGFAALGLIAGLSPLPATSATAAAPENTPFFNEFNVFIGKWKGRGVGQRNAKAAKEVVSCKGIHRWLRLGRLFEQTYTCWGADFIFSGAFQLKPAARPALCKGVSLNGAKEETGKVTCRKLESGELEFTLKKNFSKKVNYSHLKVLKNGHIDYTVRSMDPKTGETYQALKIAYTRKLKK